MSEANPPLPALREALSSETINALVALFPTSDEDDWLGTQSLASHLLEALSIEEPIDMQPIAHPRLADVATVAGALGLRIDDLDTPTLIRRFVGDQMCITISDKGWSGMGKFPPQGWSPEETKALLLALLTASATKVASNG